jgi:hypothetical protein
VASEKGCGNCDEVTRTDGTFSEHAAAVRSSKLVATTSSRRKGTHECLAASYRHDQRMHVVAQLVCDMSNCCPPPNPLARAQMDPTVRRFVRTNHSRSQGPAPSFPANSVGQCKFQAASSATLRRPHCSISFAICALRAAWPSVLSYLRAVVRVPLAQPRQRRRQGTQRDSGSATKRK